MKKLLIVDDEADIRELLKDYFELNGYEVILAKNGTEAMKKAEYQPDLILLDINMPDLDGIEVCGKIRDFVSCPIVFLTARIEDQDKITGFLSGGDDYILKPFSIDELGARVAAHLRREDRRQGKTKLRFEGDLVIDYTERTVYAKGREISLAKKEFDIVEVLSMNAGQVFDKERLYEKIWGYDSEGDSAVIAEHIRKIRAKFAAAGEDSRIDTVWGVGYKWLK